MYHRKDGVIVKVRNDLMAATRYGAMMLRSAKTKTELENWAKPIAYPEGDFGYIV